MASYPPLLPFKIHPFWFTLGYGIFVGYEIRKHDIDGIIKRKLAAKRDEAIKHQAHLLLDVAEQRKLAVPAKAENGSKA